jgi:hypothetical protein
MEQIQVIAEIYESMLILGLSSSRKIPDEPRLRSAIVSGYWYVLGMYDEKHWVTPFAEMGQLRT